MEGPYGVFGNINPQKVEDAPDLNSNGILIETLKFLILLQVSVVSLMLLHELVGGFETTQFVEIDPFCQKVLKKHFPKSSLS